MTVNSFIRMWRCSQDELEALDKFGGVSWSSYEKVNFQMIWIMSLQTPQTFSSHLPKRLFTFSYY